MVIPSHFRTSLLDTPLSYKSSLPKLCIVNEGKKKPLRIITATLVWCLLPLGSDFSFLCRRTNLLNWMPKVRPCEYFEAITRRSIVTLAEKVLSCWWTRWGRDLDVVEVYLP